MTRWGGLGGVVRAGQWWEAKIVPALAIAYATALDGGGSGDGWLIAVLPALAVLLLALASGGAGVSMLNDLADRAEDARAGKANRMAGRSMATIATIAALPLGGTIAAAWLWRGNTPALLAMAGAWAAFAAYSLPPLRLKGRGSWGVLADAAGAHLFPALMAVFAVSIAATGPMPATLWIATIAVWAMAWGVRGIIGHQIADETYDRASGSASMVVAWGRDKARRVASYIAFPVECAAMVALLWQIGYVEPWVAVGIALALIIGRIIYFQMRPVVADNVPRYFIVGQDFYTVLLPLSLLVATARQSPADGVVLALHLALFPFAAFGVARDAARIITRAVRGHHLIGK